MKLDEFSRTKAEKQREKKNDMKEENSLDFSKLFIMTGHPLDLECNKSECEPISGEKKNSIKSSSLSHFIYEMSHNIRPTDIYISLIIYGSRMMFVYNQHAFTCTHNLPGINGDNGMKNEPKWKIKSDALNNDSRH